MQHKNAALEVIFMARSSQNWFFFFFSSFLTNCPDGNLEPLKHVTEFPSESHPCIHDTGLQTQSVGLFRDGNIWLAGIRQNTYSFFDYTTKSMVK